MVSSNNKPANPSSIHSLSISFTGVSNILHTSLVTISYSHSSHQILIVYHDLKKASSRSAVCSATVSAVHAASSGSLRVRHVRQSLLEQDWRGELQAIGMLTFSPGRPMMVPLSFFRAPLTLSPSVTWRFWWCTTAGRRRLKRPLRRVVVVVVVWV